MTTLPDKPSELIRVALADLRKVEAMPETYTVDMNNWHSPDDDACHVCLAGAVVAQTLQSRPDILFYPADFDDHTADRLCALDGFRNGSVSYGLRAMRAQTKRREWNVSVAEYDVDPEAFHRDMHALADDLAAAGL